MTNPTRHLKHGRIDPVSAETSDGWHEFDAFSPAPLQQFSGDYDAESSAHYAEVLRRLASLAASLPKGTPGPANIARARDASASCSIEAIHVRPYELLIQPHLSAKPRLATLQGSACINAIRYLSQHPIDHVAILGAHRALLEDDPEYVGHTAGVYRSRPVFIVSGSRIIHCMAPPNRLDQLMADLLAWLQSPAPHVYPLDIRIALAHYQFETIHPFPDGNGRIGRAINAAIFRQHHAQSPRTPFSHSVHIDVDRQDYYRALSDVRSEADWQRLFIFFTSALTNDAYLNTHSIERVLAARQTWQKDSALKQDELHAADLTLSNPFVTSKTIRSRLNISSSQAQRILSNLTRAGILEPTTTSHRPVIHQCPAVMNAYFIKPPEYFPSVNNPTFL